MYTIVYETYLNIERRRQYEEIAQESLTDVKNFFKLGWASAKKKISELINKFIAWVGQFFSKKVYMHNRASKILFDNLKTLTSCNLESYKDVISVGDIGTVFDIGVDIRKFCTETSDSVFAAVESDIEPSPFKFGKVYSLYDSGYFDEFLDKVRDINGIIKNLEPELLKEAVRINGKAGAKAVEMTMSDVYTTMSMVFTTIYNCTNKVTYKGKNTAQHYEEM